MAKKQKTTEAKAPAMDAAFLTEMRKRAERAREFDKDNRREAIFDLEFRAGLNQWPEKTRKEREDGNRPCLTVNRIPQFIRQVTGDIRQMRPTLKAYGIDDDGDKDRAEIVTSLLRYIETRSDATDAYFRAVDSQVASGIGHWRVETEYCDDEGNEQDITIRTLDDQVGVLWDPDSSKPNREDASFCFVPVDMTLDKFKAQYPDAKASGFDTLDRYRSTNGLEASSWWGDGATIRVAEYWERRPVKGKEGRRYEVYRSIVTESDTLEPPVKWPGKYIPIIPVIGEEVRIAGRVYRHGVTRFLRDPQQRYNYWVSAQTEITALQPKAPFLVTDHQVEDHLDLWQRANQDNLPFLTYSPDPSPGAGPPQRVQPPVSSQGFAEGVQQAAEDMKAVTGIYDASLGNRSNETSGKAILARMREGDVGTYVYVDNFLRALKHTGRIILDLIPYIYDTTRTLRIIGEDGALDEVKINQPKGAYVEGEEPEMDGNVRIGKYDVFVQAGPSYTTKREEAKEGMTAFIQAFPPAAPLIADLIASSQDWPMADKIAERLKALLPPQIKAQEDAEEGDPNDPNAGMMPQAPPPEVIAQQVEQEVMQRPDFAIKAAQARKAEADAAKAELEFQLAQVQAQTAVMASMAPQQPEAAPMQPDPMEVIRLKVAEKAALTEVDIEAERIRRKMDRDMAQTSALGMGTEGAEATPLGPSPVELLSQAIASQGDAIREGMAQLADAFRAQAQASMVPTRIIRDERGRAVGAEKVMN